MHAALASIVSAWEGYVEAITIEAIDTIANCSNAEVLLLTMLIKAEAKVAIAKFNTPTAENCRGLLLRFTGFDAFPYMRSQRLSLTAHLARVRLNEILQVRHAFAHGYSVPAYSWTTRYGLKNRLTKNAVIQSSRLIDDFVSNIDSELAKHIKSAFPTRLAW